MEIKPEDLCITCYGPRGTAFGNLGVEILHRPTGIEVCCAEDRSQHRNRATCLNMLEEELYYYMLDTKQYHGEISNVSGGYYVFIRDDKFYWAIDGDCCCYEEEEIPQSLYHEFKKHVNRQ
jgi:hypothetical protein